MFWCNNRYSSIANTGTGTISYVSPGKKTTDFEFRMKKPISVYLPKFLIEVMTYQKNTKLVLHSAVFGANRCIDEFISKLNKLAAYQ